MQKYDLQVSESWPAAGSGFVHQAARRDLFAKRSKRGPTVLDKIFGGRTGTARTGRTCAHDAPIRRAQADGAKSFAPTFTCGSLSPGQSFDPSFLVIADIPSSPPEISICRSWWCWRGAGDGYIYQRRSRKLYLHSCRKFQCIR